MVEFQISVSSLRFALEDWSEPVAGIVEVRFHGPRGDAEGDSDLFD